MKLAENSGILIIFRRNSKSFFRLFSEDNVPCFVLIITTRRFRWLPKRNFRKKFENKILNWNRILSKARWYFPQSAMMITTIIEQQLRTAATKSVGTTRIFLVIFFIYKMILWIFLGSKYSLEHGQKTVWKIRKIRKKLKPLENEGFH